MLRRSQAQREQLLQRILAVEPAQQCDQLALLLLQMLQQVQQRGEGVLHDGWQAVQWVCL